MRTHPGGEPRYFVCFGLLVALLAAGPAADALLLVESIPGPDFNVAQSVVTQLVVGTTETAIHGVGFTALWTGVVRDEIDGVYPWSLDLGVTVRSPGNTQSFVWDPIGGDRTIADFPLQDFRGGFTGVPGNGTFTWEFRNLDVPSPFVAGLRNVTYHLLTEVPDVVEVHNGSVATGPLWSRPFYIGGISGLGPVVYHVVPFTVDAPGGYTFLSVVESGNNFTFLYQGGFDPDAPLANLLEYGLGNGNAPNGTPQGTSKIEVLLRENTRYFYVTSQWDRFIHAGQSFSTTITGPGSIQPFAVAPGDFDFDGDVDLTDYARFADCITGPGVSARPAACSVPDFSLAKLDGDTDVNLADIASFLSTFGD